MTSLVNNPFWRHRLCNHPPPVIPFLSLKTSDERNFLSNFSLISTSGPILRLFSGSILKPLIQKTKPKKNILHVAHKSNYLLDLEHLRVAMANSDKINSSSSLNHATLSTNQMTTDIDDVLRQFDSLNSSASFVGTNKRNSKCDHFVAVILCS